MSNLQNASLFLEDAPLQQQCRVDGASRLIQVSVSLPPPAARTPRATGVRARCCCQPPATAHLPAPQRPCHSLGSSRCSLVCFRARRARVRGELGLAPQQCSRSCTASAKCIAKPTRRFPQTRVCDAPRTTLFAAPPSGAAASPQRAAPCTPHRSYKHRAARPTASPRAYTASQKTAVSPRAPP